LPTPSTSAEPFYVFNTGVVLASFGCAVGCSGLLDIPEDPRVGMERGGAASVAPMEAVRSAPERDTDSPSRAAADGRDARSPQALPQPIAVDLPDAASTAGGSTAGGQVLDVVRPDAGAPPLDAVVTPDEPEPTPPACTGMESLGPSGNCYLASTARVSWLQAQQRCRAHGAGWELASIRSDETNQFIATLGVDEGWIGASDAQREGDWTWVADGTSFWRGTGTTGRAVNGAYERWFGDEPNGELDSACARFLTVALGARLAAPAWGDLECSESLAFVCEGPTR
jgi:hypothetical protein